MKWTKELYECWKAAWTLENPNKTPLNFEHFMELAEMFEFTPEEMFDVPLSVKKGQTT